MRSGRKRRRARKLDLAAAHCHIRYHFDRGKGYALSKMLTYKVCQQPCSHRDCRGLTLTLAWITAQDIKPRDVVKCDE